MNERAISNERNAVIARVSSHADRKPLMEKVT
jgi:hypothetical protein